MPALDQNYSLFPLLKSWCGFITGRRLAPFHSTTPQAIKAMLRLGNVTSHDTLVDLGCGDGFLLSLAARELPGLKAQGYEIDSSLAKLASERIHELGIEDRVGVFHEDARKAMLSDASVVTLYLSEAGNSILLPILKKRMSCPTPPCRIVSFCFPIEGLQPCAKDTIDGIDLFLFTSKAFNN